MKHKRQNRHHIRPKSRGGGGGKNIVLLCQDCHNVYHKSFGTMNPDEIISFLVEYYWNYQWFWVVMALRRHNKELSDVLSDPATETTS